MASTEVQKKPARKKAAKPRGRPPKYDWPTIEREYVEGTPEDDTGLKVMWPSLRELGEKHGVPAERMYDRSSQHRWKVKRDAYMAKIEAARRAARAKELAAQGVQFDERALNTAKMGMAMVTQRLIEIAADAKKLGPLREAEQERLVEGKDVDAQLLKPIIKSYELEQLAKAGQVWQQIAAKATGQDALKVEHSGPDGGPIEGSLNITTELQRDDPDRLASFVEVMQRSGLLDQVQTAPPQTDGEQPAIEAEEIYDAEIVDG